MMKLIEVAQQKGTYAGVRFDDDTVKALIKFCKDEKIPNSVPPEKLHTTVLYSRKFLPGYKPAKNTDMVGTVGQLELWPSQEGVSCLVLVYSCPKLTKRHLMLLKKHDATYDYEYKPHVTLSYDVGDWTEKDLPKVPSELDKLIINKEYTEDLDLDWAKSKK